MFGGRPAALDELLHGLLGILAAYLAGLDEFCDELFCVLLRHLGELRAGVEQTLEEWGSSHARSLPLVTPSSIRTFATPARFAAITSGVGDTSVPGAVTPVSTCA